MGCDHTLRHLLASLPRRQTQKICIKPPHITISGGLLPLLERTTAESSLLARGSPDQHLRHSEGQSSFIYCTYSNLLSIPYFIIYSNIFTLCTTNMLCCCQHCLLSIYTLTSSCVYTYLLNKDFRLKLHIGSHLHFYLLNHFLKHSV